MSYDQRLDSVFRPQIYRASAESSPQATRKAELAATGMEKSTALAKLDSTRTGPAGDRIGSSYLSQSTEDIQKQPLSFSDLIDVINPLQHIPLVSNVYRSITGDEISNPARVAGSTLFFGPIGAAASVANIAMEEFTGKDMGDHAISLLGGSPLETEGVKASVLAENTTLDTSEKQTPDNSVNQTSQSALSSLGESEELSPDQPFSFNAPTSPSVAESPRAIGFAPASEPITVDALPADILAALYSGQPARPVSTVPADNGDIEILANAVSTEQAVRNHQTPASETAPRWSLWSSPDDTLASATKTARAYGGVVPNEPVASDSIASQGGWFGASMPEVLARYNNTADLQRQTERPFIDVSQ